MLRCAIKHLDELCEQVGVDCFPLAWNGKIPTEAEKQAFYAKCRTPWTPPEASSSTDLNADEYSSEEEASDEESSDSEEESASDSD